MGICESRGNTDKLTNENNNNPNQDNITSSQQNQHNSIQIANNPATNGIKKSTSVPNNINSSSVVKSNIASLNNQPIKVQFKIHLLKLQIFKMLKQKYQQ